MSKNGKIRIIPLTGRYNAVKFQGYDAEDREITDCAETALTASPTGASTALGMVVECMRQHGYPNPEPPTDVEEFVPMKGDSYFNDDTD